MKRVFTVLLALILLFSFLCMNSCKRTTKNDGDFSTTEASKIVLTKENFCEYFNVVTTIESSDVESSYVVINFNRVYTFRINVIVSVTITPKVPLIGYSVSTDILVSAPNAKDDKWKEAKKSTVLLSTYGDGSCNIRFSYSGRSGEVPEFSSLIDSVIGTIEVQY